MVRGDKIALTGGGTAAGRGPFEQVRVGVRVVEHLVGVDGRVEIVEQTVAGGHEKVDRDTLERGRRYTSVCNFVPFRPSAPASGHRTAACPGSPGNRWSVGDLGRRSTSLPTTDRRISTSNTS